MRALKGPTWVMAAALCLVSEAANAQQRSGSELPLQVEHDAQGCVTEASLRERIARYLRVHQPIEVMVVVRADAEPVGFELRRDGAFVAERTFEVLPSSCSPRLDALALAIAVAVEHAVGPEHATLDVSAQPPSESAPDATPSEPPATVEAEPVTEAQAEREAPVTADSPEPSGSPTTPLAVDLVLFGGGSVLIEALPEPAFAVHLGGELRLGPTFALSLAALLAPGVDVELAGARAASGLAGARLLGCLGRAIGGLRFEGCAGAAGGMVWSSGGGAALQNPQDTHVGWAAGVARLAAGYPAAGLFGVRLALDGHVNLVQPGVRVTGMPPVQSVAGPVGAAGSIELWLALQ